MRSVEKSLAKVDGVSDISVNLINETVNVEIVDTVTADELRKAVEKAGYKAGPIRLTVPAATPATPPVSPSTPASSGRSSSGDVPPATVTSGEHRKSRPIWIWI